MIIQIRGTSGSGKSTVMREVMEQFNPWVPKYHEGRKKPLWYQHEDIIVLGHYESQCGGGDTIGSAPKIFDVIQEAKKHAGIILCEGLLLSEDVKWSQQLEDLCVVFLSTPTRLCVERIMGRRKEAGNDKPLNTHNTTNRVGVINRAYEKLTALGVTCKREASNRAAKTILSWIEGA